MTRARPRRPNDPSLWARRRLVGAVAVGVAVVGAGAWFAWQQRAALAGWSPGAVAPVQRVLVEGPFERVSPTAVENAVLPHLRGGFFTVDLAAQTVTAPDGKVHRFDIDQGRKASLLAGLDEIGETLEHAGAISAFEEKRKLAQPWLA